MKKKGARDIPDFSRHAPPARTANAAPAPAGKPPRSATPRPTVKPQSTSAKSGRRGQ